MKQLALLLLFLALACCCPAQTRVTFSVDMNDAIAAELLSLSSDDIVLLRGSFNFWQGETHSLTDANGDGVYDGTFDLSGDAEGNIEFKFVILKPGGDSFWERNPEPDNAPYGNRTLGLLDDRQMSFRARYSVNPWYVANIGKPVVFPVDELRADFLELRETLEQQHCCLYEYTDKETFDELFARQFEKIDRVSYFTSFIDSCFTILVKNDIGNLILDLRGNDGGDPFCAAPLFSYLECEPVPYFADSYGKYAELAEPIPLAERRFTEDLFILLDGRCASTNGHFSALLKHHGIGSFVGTPSGATYKCNAGRGGRLLLGNTHFILLFATGTFAAAVEDMDKTEPIMPDVPVHETYRDFLDGRDASMEAALKLIKEIDKGT